MTGPRKKHRYRPPPDKQAKPKGFDDVPELSAEEVERRVDVRGGGAPPRAPVERPVRTARPPRREQRKVARDALLLVGLAIVGLLAVRLFLPEGPLTATASESPGASLAAVVTTAPLNFGPTSSPLLVTLTPGETSTAAPATAAPATAAPVTPRPTPRPTLRPGQTPGPTPKPTKTPTPTPGPTAPNTARLIVDVVVITNSGGTALASNWTITVTTGGTATPSSFHGQAAGTSVTLSSGKAYSVNASGPAGYTEAYSTNCTSTTGGLPVTGQTETCTITLNDIQPVVTVRTEVDGGTQSPADWTVSVSGTNVNPSGSFAGSTSGTDVHFDANKPFSVSQSNEAGGADYTESTSGTCSSTGLAPGASVTCTFTFTYVPPPPPAPAGWLLPAVTLLGLRKPRWWTTHRTR